MAPTTPPTIRVRSYEPTPIEVLPPRREADGSLSPARSIEIRVKRLDVEEAAQFQRLMWRAMESEADRVILVRRTPDEQARVHTTAIGTDRLDAVRASVARLQALPVEAAGPEALAVLAALVDELQPTDRFVLSDDEIRRRRLLELTDEQRQHYEALQIADRSAIARFITDALAKFVLVPSGQLEWEQEGTGEVTPVTDGALLARCFGAKVDILLRIVGAIREHNELSDLQKHDSGSRFTSRTSSIERDLTVIGASSGPIAAPVGPSGSATTAGATPIAESPSGPTAT